jgi:hypothetical protein
VFDLCKTFNLELPRPYILHITYRIPEVFIVQGIHGLEPKYVTLVGFLDREFTITPILHNFYL